MENLDFLNDPEVVAFTRRARELLALLGVKRGETVMVKLELGKLLLGKRDILKKKRCWYAWLEMMKMDPHTAGELIRLAEVERRKPGFIQSIAPLGETRARRVAMASDAFQDQFTLEYTWNGRKLSEIQDTDEFDWALDNADPEAKRKPKTAKPAVVHLPSTRIAIASLQDLAIRETDPEGWRPIAEWLNGWLAGRGETAMPTGPAPAPGPIPPSDVGQPAPTIGAEVTKAPTAGAVLAPRPAAPSFRHLRRGEAPEVPPTGP